MSRVHTIHTKNTVLSPIDRITTIRQIYDKDKDKSAIKNTDIALRISLVVFIEVLSSYTMGVMNSISGLRAPVLSALPDVLFDVIPFVDWPVLPNSFAIAMGGVTLLYFAYTKKDADVIQKMLLVHSIVMLTRSVCNLITSLPDPNPQCQNVIASGGNNNIFVDGFFRVATGGFHVCGDVFFSGHIALCVICALAWTWHTNNYKAKIAAWLCVLFESWALVAVRFHYTIDVVFGMWVALQVWNMYESHILKHFKIVLEKLK